MSVCFMDSSALVKRYRFEAGSERVTALIEDSERVIVARLAHVEVSAAIVRRGRVVAAPRRQLESVLEMVDREMLDLFDVVEIDDSIMANATALARRHGLRAADAIQLACAQVARDNARQQEFVLVGSDLELNAAGSAEGISILDPTKD